MQQMIKMDATPKPESCIFVQLITAFMIMMHTLLFDPGNMFTHLSSLACAHLAGHGISNNIMTLVCCYCNTVGKIEFLNVFQSLIIYVIPLHDDTH